MYSEQQEYFSLSAGTYSDPALLDPTKYYTIGTLSPTAPSVYASPNLYGANLQCNTYPKTVYQIYTPTSADDATCSTDMNDYYTGQGNCSYKLNSAGVGVYSKNGPLKLDSQIDTLVSLGGATIKKETNGGKSCSVQNDSLQQTGTVPVAANTCNNLSATCDPIGANYYKADVQGTCTLGPLNSLGQQTYIQTATKKTTDLINNSLTIIPALPGGANCSTIASSYPQTTGINIGINDTVCGNFDSTCNANQVNYYISTGTCILGPLNSLNQQTYIQTSIKKENDLINSSLTITPALPGGASCSTISSSYPQATGINIGISNVTCTNFNAVCSTNPLNYYSDQGISTSTCNILTPPAGLSTTVAANLTDADKSLMQNYLSEMFIDYSVTNGWTAAELYNHYFTNDYFRKFNKKTTADINLLVGAGGATITSALPGGQNCYDQMVSNFGSSQSINSPTTYINSTGTNAGPKTKIGSYCPPVSGTCVDTIATNVNTNYNWSTIPVSNLYIGGETSGSCSSIVNSGVCLPIVDDFVLGYDTLFKDSIGNRVIINPLNGDLIISDMNAMVLWSNRSTIIGVVPQAGSSVAGAPFKLVLQTDGNLVVYNNTMGASWNAGTSGRIGTNTLNFIGGSLQIINTNTTTNAKLLIWSSSPATSPNISICSSEINGGSCTPLYSTKQYDIMFENGDFTISVNVVSGNGSAVVFNRSSGDIYIVYNTRVIWTNNSSFTGTIFPTTASLTPANYVAPFTMKIQNDGNFVVYDSSPSPKAFWAANKGGRPGVNTIQFGPDASLQIANNGNVFWQTPSVGLIQNVQGQCLNDNGNMNGKTKGMFWDNVCDPTNINQLMVYNYDGTVGANTINSLKETNLGYTNLGGAMCLDGGGNITSWFQCNGSSSQSYRKLPTGQLTFGNNVNNICISSSGTTDTFNTVPCSISDQYQQISFISPNFSLNTCSSIDPYCEDVMISKSQSSTSNISKLLFDYTNGTINVVNYINGFSGPSAFIWSNNPNINSSNYTVSQPLPTSTLVPLVAPATSSLMLFTSPFNLVMTNDGVLYSQDINGNVYWQSTSSVPPTAQSPFNLTINSNGSLNITDANGLVIWATNGTVLIKENYGRCLDDGGVTNGSLAIGSLNWNYSCNITNPNQTFLFKSDGTISNPYKNVCLNDNAASLTNQVSPRYYTCIPSDPNQKMSYNGSNITIKGGCLSTINATGAVGLQSNTGASMWTEKTCSTDADQKISLKTFNNSSYSLNSSITSIDCSAGLVDANSNLVFFFNKINGLGVLYDDVTNIIRWSSNPDYISTLVSSLPVVTVSVNSPYKLRLQNDGALVSYSSNNTPQVIVRGGPSNDNYFLELNDGQMYIQGPNNNSTRFITPSSYIMKSNTAVDCSNGLSDPSTNLVLFFHKPTGSMFIYDSITYLIKAAYYATPTGTGMGVGMSMLNIQYGTGTSPPYKLMLQEDGNLVNSGSNGSYAWTPYGPNTSTNLPTGNYTLGFKNGYLNILNSSGAVTRNLYSPTTAIPVNVISQQPSSNSEQFTYKVKKSNKIFIILGIIFILLILYIKRNSIKKFFKKHKLFSH